jgi:hypothetical protein
MNDTVTSPNRAAALQAVNELVLRFIEHTLPQVTVVSPGFEDGEIVSVLNHAYCVHVSDSGAVTFTKASEEELANAAKKQEEKWKADLQSLRDAAPELEKGLKEKERITPKQDILLQSALNVIVLDKNGAMQKAWEAFDVARKTLFTGVMVDIAAASEALKPLGLVIRPTVHKLYQSDDVKVVMLQICAAPEAEEFAEIHVMATGQSDADAFERLRLRMVRTKEF